MAKEKLPFQSKTIKLIQLAELANIKYSELYNRKTGLYKRQLMANEKTRIANALVKDIKSFMDDLGYEVTIHPKGS